MNLPVLPHITLNPAAVTFLILVFAAAATAFQAAFGLVKVGSVKRRVNRRLTVAEKVGNLPDLVLELRKQRGLNADGSRRAGMAWFNDLVVRSGVVYAPRQWATVSAAFGAGAGLAVGILSHKILLGLVVGIVFALVGPIMLLKFKAKKRAKMLGDQLPNALEVVVRSLEAGHPVPSAIDLVGKEMPDPIGSEFGMMADEIAFGSTLEQAVGRMSDRCRHPDMDLFAATVRLQERSGGNLVGLLKMNASTVRDRARMRLKIAAASSEGRASAMILTAAPICAGILLMVSSPHYYGDVIHERTVQMILGGVAFWMTCGNLIMRRMIDMRI
jgi:tight adherence protein B